MNKEKEFIDDLDALLSLDDLEVTEKTNELSDAQIVNFDKIKEHLNGVIDQLCQTEGIERERIEIGQKPIVEAALRSYIIGEKNFIVEAPTGAGKSIIGLLISETICSYNNRHSATYTLTPTKILQDQLDEDNKRMKLGWALLKGQGNYMCLENGENFTKRKCGKMAISKAAKLECAKTCEYIQRRAEAMASHNSVLSYAYWLSAMNYTYAILGDNAPFQPREVTIFDECHMITDTVQSMFKVEISDAVGGRIVKLIDFYQTVETDKEKLDRVIELTKNFKECFDHLMNITNEEALKDVFNTLLMTTAYLYKLMNEFVDFIHTYFPKNETLWSVGQQEFDKNYEKFASVANNMRFFLANNKDIENIVSDKAKITDGTISLLFRTLNEAQLITRHVHEFTQFAVWTSATLGGEKGIKTWAEQNGILNYSYIVMESDFEFNNSPINICSPTISMSYKDKDKNMGALMNRIMAIVNTHPDERGIIHSGTFEISNNLQMRNDIGHERLIFYKNSWEKEKAIEALKLSKNGIIVGPSLSEGLDLKNDLARFAIIAKPPFPNIGDTLNKLKLDRIAGWYEWATVVTFMQQLGRHIRNKKDWGVTYLLDSNFERLLTSSTFPNYISRRFTKINVNKMVTDFQKDDNSFDVLEF